MANCISLSLLMMIEKKTLAGSVVVYQISGVMPAFFHQKNVTPRITAVIGSTI